MKPRSILMWLVAMLVAVLVLPGAAEVGAAAPLTGTGKGEVHAYYNFEQGIAPWKATTDSLYHVASMAQQSGDNGCRDMLGNHFARLATQNKGNHIPVPPSKNASWTIANFMVFGSGVRQVTVQWRAKWSPEPTIGLPTLNGKYDGTVAYAGTNPPTKGVDLVRPSKSGLTYQWQTYKYQTYVKLSPNPPYISTPVYVGIGWDNVGDSMDLDCVAIDIAYPTTTAR